MQFNDKEILDLYKNIGKKVKELRELKNVTQLELSLDMGYKSVSLVSAAELCNDGKPYRKVNHPDGKKAVSGIFS